MSFAFAGMAEGAGEVAGGKVSHGEAVHGVFDVDGSPAELPKLPRFVNAEQNMAGFLFRAARACSDASSRLLVVAAGALAAPTQIASSGAYSAAATGPSCAAATCSCAALRRCQHPAMILSTAVMDNSSSHFYPNQTLSNTLYSIGLPVF